MQSAGILETRVKVHSWNIFLVLFKTVHIISGLYLSLQDVLKLHGLVEVKKEGKEKKNLNRHFLINFIKIIRLNLHLINRSDCLLQVWLGKK